MSISNRKLKEGTLPIIYENKLQTTLGKVYCLIVGHKKVVIETNKANKSYCICCWKEID